MSTTRKHLERLLRQRWDNRPFKLWKGRYRPLNREMWLLRLLDLDEEWDAKQPMPLGDTLAEAIASVQRQVEQRGGREP